MTELQLSIGDLTKVYWKEVSKKCNRATVFIDNNAAECLHWSGGLSLLENANHVREFSSFESAPPKERKGVFIVSNPALRTTERTLRDIISNSSLEYCIVITWCQPNVLSVWKYPVKDFNNDDKSGLEWLEDSLLDWMGNKNYTAEVFYYPIFACSPCKETFFTPTYTPLYPLLSPDLTKCTAYWKVFHQGQPVPSSEHSHWELYTEELKSSIRQLVANLHSVFGSLRVKEDIWSVGSYAKCVGDELANWLPAKNRRKTAQGSVSLILVDRTLDAAGTVLGFEDSLMGRILESHDKLEGHKCDVQVDLSSLLGISCSEMFVPSSIANPGCLDEEEESSELRSLFFGSEKDVISSLHDSLSKRSPKKSEQGQKKVLTVQGLVSDLKEYEMDLDGVMGNLASITRTQAVINASSSQDIVRRKRLQSLATQFGPHLNHSSEGVLEQITDLVLSRTDSRLSLMDVLQLLVYVYSVSHTQEKFREEEEERLKSVLGEAILKEGQEGNLDPVLLALARSEGKGEMNELVALNMVNYIWSRLEGLLSYRSALHRYSSLLDVDGNYYGFLQQLLEDVYHKDRIEVPDLHYHSGGLGAILRSGLGWLGGGSNKEHPRQNQRVIVFVLGGVTPLEVKQLQAVLKGSESKLVVGGTSILTPKDSLDLLINNNPLLNDI